MPVMSRFVTVLYLAAAVAACQDNVDTQFPAGLEPLEDNSAPAPQGGATTEELVMVSGEGDHKWVHGRGYIQAAPGAVWAAAKDPEHMVADCATSRHMATVGVEPEYEYGFRVHYEVDDIVTVAWDELWRYGTVEGTVAAPSLAMIRYQKVYGSDFISLLEGSVMVLGTDQPERTEVELIEHLSALGGNVDNIKGSMQRRFDVLVEIAHGRPLPPCP